MANIVKDPQVALGRAIRLRREELGISQQDLGLEVTTNRGYPTSRTGTPTPPTGLLAGSPELGGVERCEVTPAQGGPVDVRDLRDFGLPTRLAL